MAYFLLVPQDIYDSAQVCRGDFWLRKVPDMGVLSTPDVAPKRKVSFRHKREVSSHNKNSHPYFANNLPNKEDAFLSCHFTDVR